MQRNVGDAAPTSRIITSPSSLRSLVKEKNLTGTTARGDKYCDEDCYWTAIHIHGLFKWNNLVNKVINA